MAIPVIYESLFLGRIAGAAEAIEHVKAMEQRALSDAREALVAMFPPVHGELLFAAGGFLGEALTRRYLRHPWHEAPSWVGFYDFVGAWQEANRRG